MAKRRANGEGTITQRKDGTWQAQVSLGYENGKRNRKTVYGRTQRDAKGKRDRLLEQVSHGTLAADKVTMKAFLERWHIDKERQVKARTVELYREQAKRHILPRIGNVQLSKITPLHIQDMCSAIADNVGARTADLCRVQVLGALKQAVRWQLIPRNPAEAVLPFKCKAQPLTMWSLEEAGKFLKASRKHPLYALFYLAISTGMRRGELLGLTWEDLSEATVTVRRSLSDVVNGSPKFTHPKTEKGIRRVALSPDAFAVLGEHRKRQDAQRAMIGSGWPASGLAFTTEVGTPVHPRNLQRAFSRLQANAKVPGVRLHDLRHLHASIAIKGGMDAKVLADRLGHARASFTLDVYTHLFEEQRAGSAVSILGLVDPKVRKRPGRRQRRPPGRVDSQRRRPAALEVLSGEQDTLDQP